MDEETKSERRAGPIPLKLSLFCFTARHGLTCRRGRSLGTALLIRYYRGQIWTQVMFFVGALIGCVACLIGYLLGGMIGMAITAWTLFPLAVLWGVIEFRRFQRDRAKAIAQRLSGPLSARPIECAETRLVGESQIEE